jgi:UrcA family protein
LNALLDTQETTMNTLMISTNLTRLISTAIFGVLALSSGAMSVAAEQSDAPQAVVKFGDLNLSNPPGATALYHRIRNAAVTVCRPQDDGSLASMNRVQTCVHKAIADAVSKVDRAELFAVYNAKSGQLRPIVVAQGR